MAEIVFAMNRIIFLMIVGACLMTSMPISAQQVTFDHKFTYKFKETALTPEEIDKISDHIFDFKGHHLDSMLYLSEKVLKASSKISYNKGIANSLSYLGIYYYKKSDHSLAIKYYLQAQELWKMIGDENKVASISNNIGLIYEAIGDLENSLFYHQLAIDQSNEYQDSISLANFHLNFANAKNKYTNLDDALPYYYKAIRIMQGKNNIGDLANAYLNLGNTFGRHGIIDSVKVYFDKGLYLARQENNYLNLEYALTSQIRYYTYTENYKEALKYAEESLMAAELSNSDKSKADALYAISNIHEALGDYEKALSITRQYQEIKDSLYTNKHSLDIARIEAESKFAKDKAEFDQQIIEKEKIAYRRLFLISMLIIFIILLASIGYYVYRRGDKVLRANILLEKKNQEIKELAAESEALNAHQQVIFKILGHDLKGPVLSLATVTEMASDDMFTLEELKELLPRLSVQAKQLSVSLETLLHWAMDQMTGEKWEPEDIDLSLLIQECIEFLDAALREKSIRLDVNADNDVQIFADSHMMLISIRNVIANAIKFSKNGGMITITTGMENDMVFLKIFNNGSEISPNILNKINGGHIISESQKGTGLGLSLTRSYITKNKGTMKVQNVDGKGVEVSFYFPISITVD